MKKKMIAVMVLGIMSFGALSASAAMAVKGINPQQGQASYWGIERGYDGVDQQSTPLSIKAAALRHDQSTYWGIERGYQGADQQSTRYIAAPKTSDNALHQDRSAYWGIERGYYGVDSKRHS